MPTVATPVPLSIPAGGVRVDIPVRNVPANALVAGENFVLRDGVFGVRPGLKTFAGAVADRPTGILQYYDPDGTIITVLSTLTKWYKLSTSNTWTDISGTALTGTKLNRQVFRAFTKGTKIYALGLNGKDVLNKWDSSVGAYSAAGGTPPKAKCMAISADRLLLGNLLSGGTVNPAAIDVSALDDFESGWGVTQTSVLGETPGEIVAMLEMGDLQTVIYKDDAIYMAVASGGNEPFTFQLKLAGVSGPANPACVAATPEGTHLVFCRDGALRVFDGVSFQSLGRAVQQYILRTADMGNLGPASLTFDEQYREAVIVYPGTDSTDNNLALYVNIDTGAVWPQRWDSLTMSFAAKLWLNIGITIGELTMPIGQITRTIGSFATTVRRILFAGTAAQCFTDLASTDNGSSIPAYFETGLSDMGSPTTFKTVQEVDHVFDQAGGTQDVSCAVLVSNYGETRSLSTARTVDVGATGPYRTGHRVSGRAMGLRLDVAATWPVRWQGATAGIVERGLR